MSSRATGEQKEIQRDGFYDYVSGREEVDRSDASISLRIPKSQLKLEPSLGEDTKKHNNMAGRLM